MTKEQKTAPEQTGPSKDFVAHVKEALDHLYDVSYLQRHSLHVQIRGGTSVEIAGQCLRRELAAAIEALNPGPGVPFRAPQARPYNMVRLHYVNGSTNLEAAHDLGISLRQAYRDLRSGEHSVAAALWTRLAASSPDESRAAQLSSIQEEMARLTHRPNPTDMGALLRQTGELVGRLASQRGVQLETLTPDGLIILSVDPVVARQVLVNLLSHAVRQAQPGTLRAVLTRNNQDEITLTYELSPESADAPVIDLAVVQMADRLGWHVTQEDHPRGTREVTLHMRARGPCILVIDDNEGLVSLLERYLTDHACQVIPAIDGQEGLRLAAELLPDAIVLDVMMPEMDGWQVLQRLRGRSQTARTPVVICSVINDPDLAQSLGASHFLPKPVSRDDVLAALRDLGVV
jgi:CheY-like chemotaxis protein